MEKYGLSQRLLHMLQYDILYPTFKNVILYSIVNIHVDPVQLR